MELVLPIGDSMPQWVINLLVDLAVKYGIPALMKVFKNVPEAIWKAISDLIEHLKGHPAPEVVARNFSEKVAACIGETCKV